MKPTIPLLVVFSACIAASALGVSKYEYESDHTLLVNVMSSPSGASVYSVPTTTNDEPVLLGRTPYTALVEFGWGKGWFVRKWRMLNVRAPANICRAEYTKDGKHYDIYMMIKVEAPGYEAVHRDELIASFDKPKDFDWEDLDFLPTRQTVNVELPPAPSAASAEEPEPKAATPSLVMSASGSEEGDMGTVHVVANVEEAAVLVDGKPVGRAPVKLVLRAGEHDVEVHKPGYQSYSNSLSVKAHAQVALKVTLAKAAEAGAP